MEKEIGRNYMTIRKLTESDVSNYQALRLRALQTDPESFGSTYDLY